MIKIYLHILIILGMCAISKATMVLDKKANCPVCEHSILVNQILSCGGYIYEWKSKYDLIYWPDTEPDFIYICKNCSYAQIHNHFFDISDNQKKKLKSYLAEIWIPQEKISPVVRYDQAILVNTILDKDEDFWAWFNRILIYFYRTNNPDKAKEYAKKEIELLKNNRGELPDGKKNRLYLLGEYHRMIGDNSTAKDYFNKALRANLSTKAKAMIYISILLILISLLSLTFIWVKKLSTMKFRIVLTTIIVVLLVECSIMIYIAPKAIQQDVHLNRYYNSIIEDRLKLLDEK